jgi:hypothetical protein
MISDLDWNNEDTKAFLIAIFSGIITGLIVVLVMRK